MLYGKEVLIKCAGKRKGLVGGLVRNLSSPCREEYAKSHQSQLSLHWKCLSSMVTIQEGVIVTAAVAGVIASVYSGISLCQVFS